MKNSAQLQHKFLVPTTPPQKQTTKLIIVNLQLFKEVSSLQYSFKSTFGLQLWHGPLGQFFTTMMI
jgi:hypothetical protein